MKPKVLVAAPTSKEHSYVIDEYLRTVRDFSYDNFDTYLVDTSYPFDRKFHQKLKKSSDFVSRLVWNPKSEHTLQMLARAREKIRQFFVQHREYSFLFFLDTDVIAPRDSIERLISHDKDCVGFLVHCFTGKRKTPAVWHNGFITVGKGLSFYTWEEIKAANGKLLKVYATSIACLMVKRKVLEQTAFRTHPTFIFGEDLWWFAEVNDKGFEMYCDTSVRAVHKNKDKNSINVYKTPKVWVAFGLFDEKVKKYNVEMLVRS